VKISSLFCFSGGLGLVNFNIGHLHRHFHSFHSRFYSQGENLSILFGNDLLFNDFTKQLQGCKLLADICTNAFFFACN